MPVRRSPVFLALPVLIVAILAGGLGHALPAHVRALPTSGPDYRWHGNGGRLPLTPALRAAGLTFSPDVAPGDRAAVLAAVARVRPEARRLIDLVDGAVTVSVDRPATGDAGLTHWLGNGRYAVELDLGTVARVYGTRGITRLTVHELGHVVDFALVDDALAARLDAAIPPSWSCGAGGQVPVCGNRAERFAETFAKWATGDLGFNMWLGYAIPPPASLEAWGAPLAALGR